MLDTLFAAEQNDSQIDYRGIREEVDTFMFEGYDTTSAAIMFCILMIAHHEHEQQILINEIVSLMGKRLFLFIHNEYLVNVLYRRSERYLSKH